MRKLLIILLVLAALFIALFFASPRTVSWILSYKQECKVLRVEAFSKGMVITNFQQANKYSIICEDGFICRAEDTAFAGIKAGDEIVFRGFPELSTLEEFGKCDHAQLLKFKALAPKAAETPHPGPAAIATPAPEPTAKPLPTSEPSRLRKRK